MLHRLAAFAIVAFWFVMTLLLVRSEVSPEASRLREVPIGHVLKTLFLHEQPSDLSIFNGPAPIGNVRFHPRNTPGGHSRMLDITGELQLKLGDDQRTRVGWIGLLELTPAYALRSAKWTVTVLDPGYLRVEIDTPGDGTAGRFTVRSREGVIQEGDIPADRGALAGLAGQMELGANFAAIAKQGSETSPPIVRARQSSLHWRGEKTETWLITIEQSGQTLIEAHVSQLGQVLHATTLLGYTLRSTDLFP